jgi:16S rRNA (uracil1498-N3)-methyltransferase
MQEAKVRLYVEQPLGPGQPVALSQPQAHYLFAVMRLGQGDPILLFNGKDGEWLGRIAETGKRGGVVLCEAMTRPLHPPPDLWLVFAPIKKARTDFIVEKAVELGVARIVPVQTAHTNSERIRQDRLHAHAVEAAEQCGATLVPEVSDLVSLDRLLAAWPMGRRILWCDERRTEGPVVEWGDGGAPWAVLVGPEGGFSDRERARLTAMEGVLPFGLGPRILRADTAVVAALALWQSALGDWG